MKKLLFTAVALLALGSTQAQEVILGADFDTRFDNREYSGSSIEQSKTKFSARLTPQAGLRWDERNTLIVGAELLQDFGDKKSISETRPIAYYQYHADKVTAVAGIYERKKLLGDYSTAFFDTDKVFYDNRLQGFLGQYHPGGGSFVEFSLDWVGMKGHESREKFRILSAGRLQGGRFYGGYALSVFHFAGSDEIEGNVVDNMMINPHAGVRFSAFFDFDIRLGWLQSMQRDRRTGEGWKLPAGGQLDFSMSRWGLSLENMLYVGENQLPFFDTYGEELYSGSRFFSTRDHIYNRTTLAYAGRFYHDTVRVKAGMVFHYEGQAVGLQQIVEVSVKLQKIFRKRDK